MITLIQAAVAIRTLLLRRARSLVYLTEPKRREGFASDLESFDLEYNGAVKFAKWILATTPVVHVAGLFLLEVVSLSTFAALLLMFQCFMLTYIYLDFVEWSREKLTEADRRRYTVIGATMWMVASLGAFLIMWFVPWDSAWKLVLVQSMGILISSAVVLGSSAWHGYRRYRRRSLTKEPPSRATIKKGGKRAHDIWQP